MINIAQAYTEPAPVYAPTVALRVEAGNLNGAYAGWEYTYITSAGETLPGSRSSSLTAVSANHGKVDITVVASDNPLVTGINIYRPAAGGSTYKLVNAAILTNTNQTYTDNIADGSLGATPPTTNTSGATNLLTLSSNATGTVSSAAVSFAGPPTFTSLPVAPADPTSLDYSASMTPDANKVSQFCVIGDGNPFTINAPINGQGGQTFTIYFRNNTGSPCGTITWDSAYKKPAFTGPATGNGKTITFEYISFWGYWVMISVTADYPL